MEVLLLPEMNSWMQSATGIRFICKKGVQPIMQNTVLPVGSLVDVISYGPFRGLKGTIQTVNTIADEAEEPFCFYLVALQRTLIQEPIWFEHHEVEAAEAVAPPLAELP